MNTDTGVIRRLAQDEPPTAREVELTAEQAEIAQGMEPAERVPWWERIHGRVGGGKSRKAANPAPGTRPDVAPSASKTIKAKATADHRKAAERKTTKASRKAAHPRVKRHARSKAHRGHSR